MLSRPEVGTEVRAWFSEVFGMCRSDWEAPLPLRGEEREGWLVVFANLPLFPVTED